MKWAKPKTHIDYRHRWPTQQTLVESRESLETQKSGPRWKFRGSWPRWPKRRGCQEPGKSTHPYDTAISERGSEPGSGSRAMPKAASGGRTFCKFFTHASRASPAQEPPRNKEEPQPEPPKTPIQLLRLSRKSPPSRSK
ncbi:hypothetical protein F4861DRAFT_541947 [Xylaria intraflava]|nr:hypothetical protein F4861DRAFT_541947 [Xylaria intraflava]